MTPKEIAVVVYWSEEDQCFIAKPELPVLATHGDTRAEAIEHAEYAIDAYFELRKEKIWKPRPYVKESATGPAPTR